MLRIVLIALAIYCVIRILQRYQASFKKTNQEKSQQATLDMVQCKHCGVHLPLSESYLIGGNYFCSMQHAEQDG
jgi:uncharacterized protein